MKRNPAKTFTGLSFYAALGLLFISLAGLSCSQTALTPQANKAPETADPAKKEAEKPKFTVGEDPNELINAEGWKLPALSSFSVGKKRRVARKSGDATLRIDETVYEPTREVVITADGNTYRNVQRQPNEPDKSWDIRDLRVYSVKDRAFCYVMRGNLVDLDAAGKIKGRLATAIWLAYTDKDGDGIFETFQYTSGEIPPVPDWAAKLSR